ncbi:MAG: hypothetical protein ACLR4Z_17035 [Butyricicoccaceae bacterium]
MTMTWSTLNYSHSRASKDASSENQLKLREDGGVLEANDYAVYQKLLALADSNAQSEDKNAK